jgi:glycine/serine hydroxymethyltransferase
MHALRRAELFDIIEKEKRRQWESLALIPSEVRESHTATASCAQ